MVQDQSPYVRAAIAKNPSLPNSLQFNLADDADAIVLIALTLRKNLDLDIAVQLGNHGDPLVRGAIVNQWSQDPELLQMWSDPDDRSINNCSCNAAPSQLCHRSTQLCPRPRGPQQRSGP